MNAKIGEGAPIENWTFDVRNDNGERFIQFAQTNRLVEANAVAQSNSRRKYTRKSFDGAHILFLEILVNECV